MTKLSPLQQQADQDLNIIALLTGLSFTGYLFYREQLLALIHQTSIPVQIHFLALATCQFAVAGLGTGLVMIRRKENWKTYGLVTKNFFPTLIYLPLLLFLSITGKIHNYLPFQSIPLTQEVLASSFPINILGYLLISLICGFWEGFNYVVIANKINCRYPSQLKGIDLGAFVCALICLLTHGMFGLDPTSLFEAFTVFILIYGMLVIQRKNENAWSCVLIFFLLWNAF